MSYTYTTLKEAIKDYTQNDETTLVANLPIFIRNTEERILKNVQLELFRKNVSGSASTGNQFLQMPSDFLSPFSLSVISDSEYIFLEFKDVDFVKTYNPNPATTGIPRYFAVFDTDNFILGPTPNTNFTAELHYFYRPLSLTKSAFTLTLTSVSGTFITSDIVTGSTSGESGGVNNVPSSTSLLVEIPSGSFTVGETITGSSSGATAVISSIGADSTISWISENATLALLYGSLMEAYTFMKGEQDVMAMYDKRFGEAMMGLKMLGESKEVTDQYRTGQIVRPKR